MKKSFGLLVLASALQFAHPAAASERRTPPQEMFQGVVIAVDEYRITVRLKSDATEDFRVQDGLVFNAVHNGDQVELTVENIDGAKTIVGLRKE